MITVYSRVSPDRPAIQVGHSLTRRMADRWGNCQFKFNAKGYKKKEAASQGELDRGVAGRWEDAGVAGQRETLL